MCSSVDFFTEYQSSSSSSAAKLFLYAPAMMMVLRTVLVAPFGSQWLYMFNASTAQAGTWYDGRFFARTAFCSAFRRCHKKKNHTFSPLFFKYVHTKYTSCSLSCSYKRFFFSQKKTLKKKIATLHTYTAM